MKRRLAYACLCNCGCGLGHRRARIVFWLVRTPGPQALLASFCGFSDTFSVCAVPLRHSHDRSATHNRFASSRPQGCHSTTYLSASAQPAACLLRLMASFGPVAIKPPELGDLTSKGQDPAGCVLAVSLGVVAGGAAGIVAADNLKAPTRRSRAFVGLTVGALMSALVTTTCAKRCPTGARLALCSLTLGGALGLYGASTLGLPARRKRPPERDKDKDGDNGEDASATAGTPSPRGT